MIATAEIYGGPRIFTLEEAFVEALDACMTRVVGNAHWSLGAEIIGAGEYYLEDGVDGIISVAGFVYGPDSMMIKMVRHVSKNFGIPFL